MDHNNEIDHFGMLVCPLTKLGLVRMSRKKAEESMGGPFRTRSDLVNAKGGISNPAGVTDEVLVREDLHLAYPIVDGIPILLAPESIGVGDAVTSFDLKDPRYAEAYEEMDFYNATATDELEKVEKHGVETVLLRELAAGESERNAFPAPRHTWIDSLHDGLAQWDAYEHLGNLTGKRLLQLGGSGSHAIKFAIAGGAESWLLTPMLGEARFAVQLADSAGVGERFHAVVGIAEEPPFASASFDGIYAGGCLHHMVTPLALPEAARILRDGGKFAAVEPWRAPFYGIGTRLLGKREDAYCRPLTSERLEPLESAFKSISLIRHGTITRYPLIALEKFGVPMSRVVPWYAGKIDDAVCSILPGLRRMGSSIAILGSK